MLLSERLAWAVIVSWLVLAWLGFQTAEVSAPKVKTADSDIAVYESEAGPAVKPESETAAAQAALTENAGQASTQPAVSTKPAAAPLSPAAQAQALIDEARHQTNPYRKARLLLDADDIWSGLAGGVAESRRAELYGQVLSECKATPLAAEALFRYLDLVMQRPNPGRPVQLVDMLGELAKKHGVGLGMVNPAQIQEAIEKLQPKYPQDANYLKSLFPTKGLLPVELRVKLDVVPGSEEDDAPQEPAAPLATDALVRAIRSQNSLKFQPVLPEPNKPVTIKLTHQNPSTLSISQTLKWTVAEGTSWKVEPQEITVALGPGQQRDIEFVLTLTGDDRLAMAPGPRLESSFLIQGQSSPVALRSVGLNVDMARYYQRLMIATAPKVSSAPVIDGRLDDAAWALCTPITHFITSDARQKLQVPTDVRVCWDDKAVYVMARLTEPDLKGISTKATKRNGSVWTDDSLEVFFDFDTEKRGFVQFIVNAINVPYDAAGHRLRWDTIWTSETGREKNAWTIEMALPWEAMEGPAAKAGDRIGFQLVRNRTRAENHDYWQWSPTLVGSNLVPSRFGTLVFTGPATVPTP